VGLHVLGTSSFEQGFCLSVQLLCFLFFFCCSSLSLSLPPSLHLLSSLSAVSISFSLSLSNSILRYVFTLVWVLLFQSAGTLNFFFQWYWESLLSSSFTLSLSCTFYIVLPPSSSHICINDVCISSISNRNDSKKTKEGRGTRGLCVERKCHSHNPSVPLLLLSTLPKVDFGFHVLDLIGPPLAAAVSPLSSGE